MYSNRCEVTNDTFLPFCHKQEIDGEVFVVVVLVFIFFDFHLFHNNTLLVVFSYTHMFRVVPCGGEESKDRENEPRVSWQPYSSPLETLLDDDNSDVELYF